MDGLIKESGAGTRAVDAGRGSPFVNGYLIGIPWEKVSDLDESGQCELRVIFFSKSEEIVMIAQKTMKINHEYWSNSNL